MQIPRRVLSALTVCADNENSRYALGGLRLERDGDKAIAVATDGRRLMQVEWTEPDADGIDFGGLDVKPAADSDFARDGAILGIRDCKEIARTLKPKVRAAKRKPGLEFIAMEEASANGTLKMAASDGEATTTRTIKTLEGRFPRWRDVIPVNRKQISHMTFQCNDTNQREVSGTHNAAAYANIQKLRNDTEGVTPDASSVVRVRLDASYLAQIADAIDKMACDDETRSVDLIVPIDPSCPVTLEKVTDDITVRAIIMPLMA